MYLSQSATTALVAAGGFKGSYLRHIISIYESKVFAKVKVKFTEL